MSYRTSFPLALAVCLALLALYTCGVRSERFVYAAPERKTQLTQAPSPTPCPIATPPVFQVDPPSTPTTQPSQTLHVTGGPWRSVVAVAPTGTLTGTVVTTTHFYPDWFITVTLQPGTNPITVTATSVATPPCSDTPVTLSTTVQIERILVCPPVAYPGPFVQPLITTTTSFTQIVRTTLFGADALTVSVRGPTQTALFTGAVSVTLWSVPIDLRGAGARLGATGRYSVEVSAHLLASGDPACGLGERVISTTNDLNGNPLTIDLARGVCPAAPSRPPRVWPVVSPWLGATQVISGDRGPFTQRVLVLNGTSRFTATLPASTTWRSEVGLAYGVTNTLSVLGIDFPDTQCESALEVNTDINGKSLTILELLKRSIFMPVAVTRR